MAVRKVELPKVTKAVKELFIDANYFLPEDVTKAFEAALEKERSLLGKEVLNTLLENSRIAKTEGLPYCQDTGVAIVFLDVGEDVVFDGPNLLKAVNDGIREAQREGYLRASMVVDPLQRKNTGDNTPAMVHMFLVPGDEVKIKVGSKGTGAENMSALKMLRPVDGIQGMKNFVLETVRKAGPNACPPLVVGVGIGGTFEECALLAKKAIYRDLYSKNPDPFYSKLESDLLEEINKLGVGPMGLGGTTTALALHIEFMPCHIGALPVAVNLDCHAHRHKEIVL